MNTKSLLSRKLQLAFASAILALFVVGAISYRSVVVSSESDRWLRHTHEVLEKLQDLLAAVQAVELNTRGYLLTGEESFLVAYHAGVLRTKYDQTIVRNLTLDNAEQQRRLDALELLASQKFQLAEEGLGLRQTIGLGAATDAIQRGSGKPIMDDFQTLIGQMQDEEQQLLALREADAKRHFAADQNGFDPRNRTGLVDCGRCGMECPARSRRTWSCGGGTA